MSSARRSSFHSRPVDCGGAASEASKPAKLGSEAEDSEAACCMPRSLVPDHGGVESNREMFCVPGFVPGRNAGWIKMALIRVNGDRNPESTSDNSVERRSGSMMTER